MAEKRFWSNNRVSTFFDDVQKMTPKAKALLVIKVCRILLDLVGVRFLSDMKIFWLSYGSGVMVSIYLLLAIYTVIYNTYHDNFSHGIKATCVVGVAVPAVLLYFQTINSNRYRYRRMLLFATDYIYMDSKDNGKLYQLCDAYGTKSIKMTIIFLSFIFFSTAQAMVGPMIEFMKTGELVTFLAIKLPFVDESNVLGFHLNLALQSTITMFGTIGSLAIETTSCVINNTVMLCAEIISFDCKGLTQRLENRLDAKMEMVARLRNIFAKYQDLDQFLLDVSDLNYWRTLSAPFLIVYSVSMSIFCQYALDFPCGYGFAFLTYSQLMIICYMGNNVLQSNNRVVDAFSSLPWYLLPLQNQKDIAHILSRAQNGTVLRIGPFSRSRLDYQTATELTSTIYRILMICMRFLEEN